ncbi:decaprenyl-phosphate phosphoribosyltransferase [Candidatus Daviesbacteria bacterium]|nr:decaprenyl-phosphate phosphoribosyltransferase [Candidatus Daviesbacteria bacterium]
MAKMFWGLIKEVRPRQWIKNLALFAGLVFSGQLDKVGPVISTIEAFIIFCAITSAVYLVNDVFDLERDRQHPFKKFRPIASGVVPAKLAIIVASVLILAALPLSYKISPIFFLTCVIYLVMQIFYSAYLRTVILLDIMVIAASFVLRVYAGIWVIDAHLNVWFLLSIISFALFIATGKRRSELTLMQGQAAKTRETLLHYPQNLLDSLTSMFANSTWLTYALFTFQQPPVAVAPNLNSFLTKISVSITEAKYLMITIPIVIYGVMRYLYVIYEKNEGESPERALLTDTPLLTTVVLWLILLLVIIYYFGG